MLDSLDRQILETINRSPSIIRSVTEKEIRSGVLLPSITTIDIKRNLPRNVDVQIIEGRLRVLENEGYIYYKENRWWLTRRGEQAIGITDIKQSSSGPIRQVLEETFSRFETELKPFQESTHTNQIEKEPERADKKLGRGDVLEPAYNEILTNITEKLSAYHKQFLNHVSKRKEELLLEIKELEIKIEIKKKEVDDLEKILRE